MSDQNSKTYTAEEAAVLVLKKTEELLKASSLMKSNTSHEVENGQEPSTEDAECPAYLADADIESGSSTGKHGEGKAGGAPEMGGEAEAGEGESLDENGKKKKKEGESEVPEHEAGMDDETKAIHDATESESDAEEVSADKAVAAQKADEADADKIEDKEEKKKEDAIEKSLFEDKSVSICESEEKPTKSDVFYDIKRCVERLKDMKELKWTVTEEAPEAKNAFEKEFTKEKSKLAGYVKKYNGLKKSEDIDENESSFMAKAEAYVAKSCKGSECGQMPTDLKKPNKLKSFMQGRESKKKIAKARVDEGKTVDQKQTARRARNSRVKFPAGRPEGSYKGKKVRPRKPGEGDKVFGEPRKAKINKNKKVEKFLGIEGKKPEGGKPAAPSIPVPKKQNAGY